MDSCRAQAGRADGAGVMRHEAFGGAKFPMVGLDCLRLDGWMVGARVDAVSLLRERSAIHVFSALARFYRGGQCPDAPARWHVHDATQSAPLGRTLLHQCAVLVGFRMVESLRSQLALYRGGRRGPDPIRGACESLLLNGV